MIIYLHDSRSPFEKHITFSAHKSASDVEHVVIYDNMSMSQIAQAVIKKAGKRHNIWLLMILAHGNRGQLQLGTGLNISTAQDFKALRSYMTPSGRGIEIHGCAVASDTSIADVFWIGIRGTFGTSSPKNGVNMLKALSRSANCIVKGAIDAQRVDKNGRYNGPYVVVHPSGLSDVRKGEKVHWIR